jgi:hypothetical protein
MDFVLRLFCSGLKVNARADRPQVWTAMTRGRRDIMHRFLITGTVVLTGALAAHAQAPVLGDEGRELAAAVYASMDADASGAVSEEEARAYNELVIASMDVDQNGAISSEEWQVWGFGFETIAAETNQSAEFHTAERIIFDLMDRDNDGVMSTEEVTTGLRWNFGYADVNGDGSIDQEEHLLGFVPNIAYRAALE